MCVAGVEWVVWVMDGGCWVVVVGGGGDDSVWMVSARSDVKNVVGDKGQEVEQQ